MSGKTGINRWQLDSEDQKEKNLDKN